MSTYNTKTVEEKLAFLHQDAKKDYLRAGKGIVKSIFRPMQASDFENVYLPISKQQGESFREIIIKNNFKNVVEFGTSFGISTIYLADAVKQTGGKVTTTELLESKAKTAEINITEAGLNDFVEIKVGDAIDTLKNYSEPIDFLFLDGWKDLYLPLFKMLEPLFHSKTMIYADNMDMGGTKPYANYILGKNNFETKIVDSGKGFLSTAA